MTRGRVLFFRPHHVSASLTSNRTDKHSLVHPSFTARLCPIVQPLHFESSPRHPRSDWHTTPCRTPSSSQSRALEKQSSLSATISLYEAFPPTSMRSSSHSVSITLFSNTLRLRCPISSYQPDTQSSHTRASFDGTCIVRQWSSAAQSV